MVENGDIIPKSGSSTDRRHYEKANVFSIRDRIKSLIDNGIIASQAAFLRESNLEIHINAKRFSEWINTKQKWNIVNAACYKHIIEYMEKKNLLIHLESHSLLDEIDDPLFHSLNYFLEIKEYSLENIRNRSPGKYILYTNSLFRPNHFVVGAIWIYVDKYTNAIKTKELQIYSGKDGSRMKREKYEGYLIRKSKKYIIISKDKSVSSLQIYFLPHFFREEKEIITFEGLVIGMVGGRAFSRPVILERFDGEDEELISKLDVYPEDRIPAFILSILKNEREYKNLNLF